MLDRSNDLDYNNGGESVVSLSRFRQSAPQKYLSGQPSLLRASSEYAQFLIQLDLFIFARLAEKVAIVVYVSAKQRDTDHFLSIHRLLKTVIHSRFAFKEEVNSQARGTRMSELLTFLVEKILWSCSRSMSTVVTLKFPTSYTHLRFRTQSPTCIVTSNRDTKSAWDQQA